MFLFCRNRGRKKYTATTRKGSTKKNSVGKRGGSKSRGGQRGRGAVGGRNSYGASTSGGSYQTMQSNRSLPPSNRPGFMPAPRVAMLQK